ISGSITTDGTLGSLSTGNFTAWTWTLSTGSTVHGTVASTDAGTGMSLFGTVTATATDITIGQAPDFGFNSLGFINNNLSSQNGVSLKYIRSGNLPPFDPAFDLFTASYISETFFATNNNPPGLALPSVTTEPSTWVIAAMGGLGVVFHGLRRRKNRVS
ncbi:MAG: hypothetical protein NT069_29580, partial [Planctomycetota bacterium]|nr:hypothetical protein [Planctomycetota bacterium]